MKCALSKLKLYEEGDPERLLLHTGQVSRAHLDYMQSKLNQWKGSYDKTSSGIANPDMNPMDQTAINTYLASNAVAQG